MSDLIQYQKPIKEQISQDRMIDIISEFMPLMQGAMRTDSSSVDLSTAKLDGSMWIKSVGKESAEIHERHEFVKLFDELLTEEAENFPLDYIKQLQALDIIDLSRHYLSRPLYISKPLVFGKYQGFTLPEVSILDPDGGYTVQLAQIIYSLWGEPIEPGLKLIVKSAPKLLTPKVIPIDGEGKSLLPGFVYPSPQITEIFNLTDVLTGGGPSTYIVLRGNRQLSDPYPGTQRPHKERVPLFALSRLNGYMNAMLDAIYERNSEIIRDIRYPKS